MGNRVFPSLSCLAEWNKYSSDIQTSKVQTYLFLAVKSISSHLAMTFVWYYNRFTNESDIMLRAVYWISHGALVFDHVFAVLYISIPHLNSHFIITTLFTKYNIFLQLQGLAKKNVQVHHLRSFVCPRLHNTESGNILMSAKS